MSGALAQSGDLHDCTVIAAEGFDFTVDGTRTVLYGANGTWTEREVTGTGSCTNRFFGVDPLPGERKVCVVAMVEAPPVIVSAPANQTVPAGQSGTFTITASGSAPFAYQWFKNGAAVAGATASSVSVLADPADVDGTYQITVEVSNAQGTVTSAPAVMSIVATGTGLGGTVVSAAEGGSVEGSSGETLAVEPGALGADTVITLVSQPVADGSLPAGITALSNIVEITPANLGFQKPVVLTLAVNKVVPEGTALAVLYLDAGDNVVAQGRSKALAVPATARREGRARAAAIAVPGNLLCQDRQAVDSGSKFTLTGVAAAVRTVLVAVPESMCASIAVPGAGTIPADTVEACSRDAQFGPVGSIGPAGVNDEQSALLNRHVDCRASTSVSQSIDVDMLKADDGSLTQIAPASAAEGTTESVQVGNAVYEFQLSTFGTSNILGKTLR